MFALNQAVAANYDLARQDISGSFPDDFESDQEDLETARKEAMELFEKWVEKGRKTRSKEGKGPELAVQTYDSYQAAMRRDTLNIRKGIIRQIESLETAYAEVLKLICEMGRVAGDFHGQNFVNNSFLDLIRNNEFLKSRFEKINLWKDQSQYVRQWYREIIRKDDTYLDYEDLEKPGFEDDKQIVNHILRKVILQNELVDAFLEEHNMYWAEDKSVIKSMVKKMMKSSDNESDGLVITELSLNWEEDQDFILVLYNCATEDKEKLDNLIAEKARNWDLERIATVDRLLLRMAICEMIKFPGIPIKVTINEYVDISKKYSTPKSWQFINGVLDGISKDLVDEGVIKKSGRGLIDNK